MSTTVIINPKGLGEVINPYPRIITPLDMSGHHDERNQKWIDFENENPALPVITAAGETLTDGRYECEKTNQFYTLGPNGYWADCTEWMTIDYARLMNIKTRQVWKVIETPELPGKETVEETLMNASIDYALSQTEDINGKIKKEQTILSCSHDFRSGANWQKEHSIDTSSDDLILACVRRAKKNSIDRDKVTGAIEKFYFPDSLSEHQQVVNEVLTDLLQVIKQMK